MLGGAQAFNEIKGLLLSLHVTFFGFFIFIFIYFYFVIFDFKSFGKGDKRSQNSIAVRILGKPGRTALQNACSLHTPARRLVAESAHKGTFLLLFMYLFIHLFIFILLSQL